MIDDGYKLIRNFIWLRQKLRTDWLRKKILVHQAVCYCLDIEKEELVFAREHKMKCKQKNGFLLRCV